MGKRLLEERKWGKLLLDNVLSNYQKFAQSLTEVEIYKCNDGKRKQIFPINNNIRFVSLIKCSFPNTNIYCFTERPLMTRLHRVPSDFATPKVRDSFVSKFVYDTEDDQVTTYFSSSHLSQKITGLDVT
jgi:hypothetical protein